MHLSRLAALTVFATLMLQAPAGLAQKNASPGTPDVDQEAATEAAAEDADVAEPPTIENVRAAFAAAFADECWALEFGPDMEPEVYDIGFRYKSDEGSRPERSLRIYRLFCGAGAYNESHVYFAWDADAGLRPQAFAQPAFHVTYEPDGGFDDTVVKDVAVTGMAATFRLVNSSFDPATGTITSHSYWRGLGDASSSGVWVLDEGEFALATYDIDASYDGEANPVRVVDYSSP